MNQNEIDQSSKDSIVLIMYVTMTVIAVTFCTAIRKTTVSQNVFDFSLNAVDHISYSLTLIIVLLSALPLCLLLFHRNNISITSIFIQKEYLKKDIIYGILGAILSSLVTLIMSPLQNHFSTTHVSEISPMPVSTIILRFIALGIVSGILKELYFRGIAMHLLSKSFGVTKALILTNILFGLVDWYNLGDSFFSGLIWIFLYKKRPRLIVPILAHGLVNAVGVLLLL